VLVGMCVSATIMVAITPDTIQSILGLDAPLSAREFAEMKSVTMGVTGHMLITLPFFVLSRFFYKEPSKARLEETSQFFKNIDTEIVVEDTAMSISMDNKQHMMLGRILLAASVAIALLFFVPNPLWGKGLFLIVAAIVAFIGLLLTRAVKPIPLDDQPVAN